MKTSNTIILILILYSSAFAQDSLNVEKIGEIAFWEHVTDLTVTGDYAYITPFYGLHIVDISDPSNLHEVSYIDCDGWHYCVAVDSIWAFVGGGFFKVVDISNPLNPVFIRPAMVPSSCQGVVLADRKG